MGQCDFGVDGDAATIVVTLPDGRKRPIFFENGKAVGADTSQADGDKPFRAEEEADLYLIRVGDALNLGAALAGRAPNVSLGAGQIRSE